MSNKKKADELEEEVKSAEDLENTEDYDYSPMHPNETVEEFMEHENFGS